MFVKNLKECPEFVSGDKVVLRELLHSAKGDFEFRYSLAHAKLASGEATLPHKLKTSEVYYILKGEGMMHIDEGSRTVGSGDVVYIPPRAVQYIESVGKVTLEFLCIVDPAWREADEEILG
ncbi:MAG: cupin domain-containing protein [Candidatus Omnitrophica bacterium]|nr:cupin domain-containing protein [Candidatus Omnitrophota bacterium]